MAENNVNICSVTEKTEDNQSAPKKIVDDNTSITKEDNKSSLESATVDKEYPQEDKSATVENAVIVRIEESIEREQKTDESIEDTDTLGNGNSQSTIAEDDREITVSDKKPDDIHVNEADGKLKANFSSVDISVENVLEHETDVKIKTQRKRLYNSWSKLQTTMLLLIVFLFVLWIVLYFSYITGYPLPFVRDLLKSWFDF